MRRKRTFSRGELVKISPLAAYGWYGQHYIGDHGMNKLKQRAFVIQDFVKANYSHMPFEYTLTSVNGSIEHMHIESYAFPEQILVRIGGQSKIEVDDD